MVTSVTPFARVDHPPGAAVFKPIRFEIERGFHFGTIRIELSDERGNRPPFGAADTLIQVEYIERLFLSPDRSRDRRAEKVNVHVSSNFHITQKLKSAGCCWPSLPIRTAETTPLPDGSQPGQHTRTGGLNFSVRGEPGP